MPDDKKPPKKKSSPPSKPATDAASVAGPPPMGNPLAGGGLGVPPPMPGEGIDPYAALAGMISQTPPPGSPGMGGPPGMGGGPPGMGMPMPAARWARRPAAGPDCQGTVTERRTAVLSAKRGR
jgi:hypothetical protein